MAERERKPDPRSGVDEEGRWSPAFEGQRRPFEPGDERVAGPGNERAVTHGAYSKRRLLEAVEAEYEALRAALVPWEPAFELPVRQLAEIRARTTLAYRWLDEHDIVDDAAAVRPILRELPAWERRATDLFRELALTVRSRVELDLDRIARERGLVELAEVERLQGIYHAFIVELLDAGERGEPISRDEMLRRLEARLVSGFGGGDVVEGSARALDPGEGAGGGA